VIRFWLLDSVATAMVMTLISAAVAAKRATRSSPLPVVVPAMRLAEMKRESGTGRRSPVTVGR
jgi:hypothetical protein